MSNSSTLEIPQNLLELSEREKQLAWLVVGGCTDKEIATSLSISTYTVNMHLRHIYKKWEIDNRAILVKYFICHYCIPQIIKNNHLAHISK